MVNTEINTMTIVQAWNELKKIENQIDLLETLKTTKKDVKTVKLKEILVSGGKVNNYAILNAIISTDEYSEQLNKLYKSKNAYEKYILEEIDRIKRNNPNVAVGFLKDHIKLTWIEIEEILNYSERQLRRFYDEYKGLTPKENCG